MTQAAVAFFCLLGSASIVGWSILVVYAGWKVLIVPVALAMAVCGVLKWDRGKWGPM